jgi:hypothetical protein
MLIIFSPFYFQQYFALIPDLLNITLRGERTFGPVKINVKQSIPANQAVYCLSVTVFPYKSI